MEILQVRVVVPVDDLERAVSFYRDALGLPLRERWQSPSMPGAIFDTGRGQIQVYAAEHDAARLPPPTIMLVTPSVDREHERLGTLGVAMLWGPANTAWGTRQLALRDPDGTLIVLCSAVTPEVPSTNGPASGAELPGAPPPASPPH